MHFGLPLRCLILRTFRYFFLNKEYKMFRSLRISLLCLCFGINKEASCLFFFSHHNKFMAEGKILFLFYRLKMEFSVSCHTEYELLSRYKMADALPPCFLLSPTPQKRAAILLGRVLTDTKLKPQI